jgi:hypothetical protein
MTYQLTPEDAAFLRGLRAAGCAVCVFLPHEVEGTDPEAIEDAMAEAGWNQISFDSQVKA